jgi:hypothetical protein
MAGAGGAAHERVVAYIAVACAGTGGGRLAVFVGKGLQVVVLLLVVMLHVMVLRLLVLALVGGWLLPLLVVLWVL